MKNKINFKLTAILVSLFIGFLLIVLGNKNKYCLSFGLIFLAIALLIYITDKYKKISQAIIEVDIAIEETEMEDFDIIMELTKQKKMLKKQKGFTCIMCFCFAAFLIVFGIANLF